MEELYKLGISIRNALLNVAEEIKDTAGKIIIERLAKSYGYETLVPLDLMNNHDFKLIPIDVGRYGINFEFLCEPYNLDFKNRVEHMAKRIKEINPAVHLGGAIHILDFLKNSLYLSAETSTPKGFGYDFNIVFSPAYNPISTICSY